MDANVGFATLSVWFMVHELQDLHDKAVTCKLKRLSVDQDDKKRASRLQSKLQKHDGTGEGWVCVCV